MDKIRYNYSNSFPKNHPIRFHKPFARVHVCALDSSRTQKQPAYPAYLTMNPHLTPFIPHPNLHPHPLSHNYPAYLAIVLLRDKRDKRLLFPFAYYIRARVRHSYAIPMFPLFDKFFYFFALSIIFPIFAPNLCLIAIEKIAWCNYKINGTEIRN